MTSFEAIFEAIEPDPTVDNPGEFADVAFTTYDATAARTGKQWSVTVHGLPDGHAVRAQGATWTEAQQNAHACVVDLLQVEPYTVGVRLAPDDVEAAAALEAVIEARVARAVAEEAERGAVGYAARVLTGRGWSTRDAGSALGLSHQRVSQLAPRTTV